MQTINDITDEREPAMLAYRAPANDNLAPHRPALAPANDNRRGAWIERDAAGNPIRVVRGHVSSQVACDVNFRAVRAAAQVVAVTTATLARHRLDAWRATAPANDSEIFGRSPRNKGGHPLEGFSGELGWWRTMTGTPSAWDDLLASANNDNAEGDEPAKEERENEEIRPSKNELMRSVPMALKTVESKNSLGETMSRDYYDAADIEWRNGRISRLGGTKFATASKWLPDDENTPSNVAGAVLKMPWAGTLKAFRPEGRTGWSFPTEHAREHRGSQGDRNDAYLYLLESTPLKPGSPNKQKRRTDPVKSESWLAEQGHNGVTIDAAFRKWLRSQDFGSSGYPRTVYPVGLPCDLRLRDIFMSGRTVPGAGTKDGSGNFDRVRRPEELGELPLDATAETSILLRFRLAHGNHAAVLDTAMTAPNMTAIAEASGSSSPHTGKSLIASACLALREFLRINSDNAQIMTSRAA